jgi:hypothetical protein
MKITGTFLDEITHDIPSNNWGAAEWAADFKVMKSIGIDTVILIRAGVGRTAACPSKVLTERADIYPVYTDLVDLFLTLAEENELNFYFGTFDSATWPSRERTLKEEVDLGKAFIDESWEKYGSRSAFKGWYLTFEISKMERQRVECLRQLGLHCKGLSPTLPNLISPFIHGSKQFDDAISLEQHCSDWDEILAMLSDAIDIVAFQDGQVDYDVLPDFLQANIELIRKHNLTPWSNTESFDRDMPFNFPPIDWRKLWWKMQAAEKAGVEKLITFEFSHFMSPNSCWPAAKNLFNRYCEYLQTQDNSLRG